MVGDRNNEGGAELYKKPEKENKNLDRLVIQCIIMYNKVKGEEWDMAKREKRDALIALRIPRRLVKELKGVGDQDDRSVSWLVVRAVEQYLADRRKGGK